MAIVYMTPVKVDRYDNTINENFRAYEYEDTITGGAANGDTVIIPVNIKSIQATLIIAAGSGKIQTTTSSVAKVIAGTETWVDWDLGVITSTDQDSCMPVTAIRQVNASGTTTMQLRAQ